jgi:two-component system nitrogen regulation sensor histidine kinase NtrY
LRVQEKHYFLDKIITASPSGIVTFDFDNRIDIVNPAAERILQTSTQELQGKPLTSLPGSFPQALSQLVTGEAKVLNLRGRRRMKCHKSVFLDQGFPRQFLMMEELTEELRQSEKSAYEKLIRLMSHEVNNSIGASNSLLNSCLNYRDQIRDEDRADFESALQIAISRTNHLSAFTRSFAEVIRIPPPHLQPCDVLSLLRQIALLLRPESQRRAITWNWVIEDEIEPVLMDKNQMEQVFVNILKNALEAIGHEGNITVKVGKKRGQQFVLIEDSGSGIPPEVQQNLFTPFFTTKENGQGMGLTLVQEILSRHHFDYSLESPPGRPTQFAIYF